MRLNQVYCLCLSAAPFPLHYHCVYVCALLIAAIWPCFSRTKQTVEEKTTTTTATPIQQLPGLPLCICVCVCAKATILITINL